MNNIKYNCIWPTLPWFGFWSMFDDPSKFVAASKVSFIIFFNCITCSMVTHGWSWVVWKFDIISCCRTEGCICWCRAAAFGSSGGRGVIILCNAYNINICFNERKFSVCSLSLLREKIKNYCAVSCWSDFIGGVSFNARRKPSTFDRLLIDFGTFKYEIKDEFWNV